MTASCQAVQAEAEVLLFLLTASFSTFLCSPYSGVIIQPSPCKGPIFAKVVYYVVHVFVATNTLPR